MLYISQQGVNSRIQGTENGKWDMINSEMRIVNISNKDLCSSRSLVTDMGTNLYRELLHPRFSHFYLLDYEAASSTREGSTKVHGA